MRLFVALDLPGEIRQKLGDLIAQLKSKYNEPSAPASKRAGKVRWSRPEAMHVTLKFIGHAIDRADTEKFDALRTALSAVRSNGPIDMRFRGVGLFPDARRPRVLYCGVEASANLPRLAADIEHALEPMGIPAEGRKFVPHLTLARFDPRQRDAARSSNTGQKSGRASGAFDELIRSAAEGASRDFGSASETQFHLFESFLKPTGSEYKKIETYSFWKEAV